MHSSSFSQFLLVPLLLELQSQLSLLYFSRFVSGLHGLQAQNSTSSELREIWALRTSKGCADDNDIISVCSFRWDGNNGNCIIFSHVLVFVPISRSAWINWNCFNFILWNSTRHDRKWLILVRSNLHGHVLKIDCHLARDVHLRRFMSQELWLIKNDSFWSW